LLTLAISDLVSINLSRPALFRC